MKPALVLTLSQFWDVVPRATFGAAVTGFRDGIAVRAHAFQVKLNRLADEVFHSIQRFARSTKARHVESVIAPPRQDEAPATPAGSK
jgi:hypothetical protein